MPVKDIPTLDDVDISNKRVFLRVDLNVPVGKNGEILDTEKFRDSVDTLKEIVSAGSSVVVATHQGRPGSSDFISTEQHAKYLSEFSGINVEHVDDVMSRWVRERISSMKPGEVIMLENLRIISEENEELSIDKLLRTHFVRRLGPLFDVYVNDAFQTIHRGHPSLVAFPYIKPSAAGRLMEKMLRELWEIDSIEGRRVFLLGGSKVEDKLKVSIHALRHGKVDEVLSGGLLGILLAMAAGHSAGKSAEIIDDLDILLPAAKELLSSYKDRVFYPVDFIVTENGKKNIVPVYSVPKNAKIVDIGPGTVEIYKERMKNSDLVIANGPMGIFEDPEFRYGTMELIKAAKDMKGRFVFCGGHLSSAARMLELKNSRIYTAGGAILYSLAGMPLPALDALREGSKRAH
ncbi:MAG: phosphoglycerate kinase [Candidatus Methanodesulfokora sp.]|jgi:phosphoglycerate kinase|nr:MAG: phosphoglycerate kinase [Candidatus Korarchaeota archaeon]